MLLLAIPAFLAYRALVSPDVQFLAPAAGGYWIVHPDLLDDYWGEAIFLRRFTLPEGAAHYPVRIAAMRRCELTVNGRSLPTATSHN